MRITKINHRSIAAIATVAFIFLLSACSSVKPPIEFAPNGEIIQKAIALQLSQTQQRLGQQLNASRPEFKVTQISVKKIEPIAVGNLAAYHLQGTYNLTLILPRQQVKQKNNNFDLYLQRQIEGKTWRLLKRNANSPQQNQWSSYIIR
jgi:hydroxypyruvate isomerase